MPPNWSLFNLGQKRQAVHAGLSWIGKSDRQRRHQNPHAEPPLDKIVHRAILLKQ